MLFSTKIRRVAMAAALALPLAACDDDTTGPEHAEVSAVRLTVGGQNVTVSSQGAQTGALTVPRGATNVTVTWLDDDGDAITEFEEELTLQIAPATGTAGVTFATTNRTSGVLTTTTAGQKTLRVSLMHDDHPDFAQNVTITSN